MAQTLEQKVDAPQEKKEEKKPIGALESVINETFDLAKTTANLGIAVGLPYGADKYMSGLGARATAGAFYLASDDKSSKSARQESIVGTAFAAFAHYTMQAISATSAYAKAALVPLWVLGANAVYMASDHIVKEKSLRGLGTKFKDHYASVTKKVLKWLAIPTYLTTFLPGIWQVPSIAVQSYVFRKFIAPHKKEPKEVKDRTPYFSNAIKKIGSATASPFKALYEISGGFYKPPKEPSPQQA